MYGRAYSPTHAAGRHQPVRAVPRQPQRQLADARAHVAEAIARPLVERPVTDDDLCDAGRDRHGRLHDGAARRAAAVRDPAEHRHLADAEVPRQLHLLGGVHRERDEPVDVGRTQPGVGQRRLHGFARELQLGAARFLGELGLPDAGDRGAPRERLGHTRVPTGTLSAAVPPTCSPSSFVAAQLDLDDAEVTFVAQSHDRSRVGQRVTREHRYAEPDPQVRDHGVGTGPVGQEAAAVRRVRQDVHEDVGSTLHVGVVAVVVHRHEVARRDRARDDARRRHLDDHRGDLVAHAQGVEVDSRAVADHVASRGSNSGSTRSPSKCS